MLGYINYKRYFTSIHPRYRPESEFGDCHVLYLRVVDTITRYERIAKITGTINGKTRQIVRYRAPLKLKSDIFKIQFHSTPFCEFNTTWIYGPMQRGYCGVSKSNPSLLKLTM